MGVESVYVECEIHAPIEQVWRLTQTPELHERWDLRFTRIEYLPESSPDAPQRFLYSTRIGFGVAISGEGESVGESNLKAGTRTSALKFWSDDSISLIREGSGYWQYRPADTGTNFHTRYDLWAERDIPPELSRLRTLTHLIARSSLALAWFYHGLVPKLLYPGTGEGELTAFAGIPKGWVGSFITGLGLIECLFGLALLLMWRTRWLLIVQIPILLLIPLGLIAHPEVFTRPFTPVTLNLCMAALAFLGAVACHDLPRAGRCLREAKP
ncbi:DoxX-like family protein [soil metagenome]